MSETQCAPKAGLLIHEISKLFHDRMRKSSDDLGFKAGYRQILRFLAHEDGVTQVDIARHAHFTAPTVSVTLKKMEDEGLIRRKTDKNDTRRTRVFITAKGKTWEAQFHEKVMECEEILIRGFSEEESAEFSRLLKKARENILAETETEDDFE
ncbi:MAG: MarR family transcriptional regulator [Clostridia bacterium]|nr:MarR family transcriptional regulator [Clostridia bacterium]